ncbi:MAG: nickel-binding protein [Gammaproteobacteria bacterium]|jgi:hypothetical protein
MPVFLVERDFAEKLELSSDSINQINDITNELGAEWLYSFLSADGKKTYCLYEAKDPDLLRHHAKVVGIPLNKIVQVDRFWPHPDNE